MVKRNIPALNGMLAGVLAVVLAVLLFTTPGNVVLNYNEQPSGISSMDTGTRTSYNYYGGDAYTGIQQASADAARNVKTQSEIILSGFRSLPRIVYGSMPTGFNTDMTGYAAILLCMGLGMICHFGTKLSDNKAKANFEKKVIDAIAALAPAEEPVEEVVAEEIVTEETEEPVPFSDPAPLTDAE